MFNRYRSCILERDFIIYSDNRHNQIAPQHGEESNPMPLDTWAYNHVYGAAHVNDSEVTKKGGFAIPLGYLKRGDVVRASAEIMYISGNVPRISIGRNTSGIIDGAPVEVLTTVMASTSNQFRLIVIEVTVNKDAYYSLFC
ncbi:hypothetical protein GNF83_17225, partial [Clostridium perfringens]|nr:hypothetical protein [Clostridium perfringens]